MVYRNYVVGMADVDPSVASFEPTRLKKVKYHLQAKYGEAGQVAEANFDASKPRTILFTFCDRLKVEICEGEQLWE